MRSSTAPRGEVQWREQRWCLHPHVAYFVETSAREHTAYPVRSELSLGSRLALNSAVAPLHSNSLPTCRVIGAEYEPLSTVTSHTVITVSMS